MHIFEIGLLDGKAEVQFKVRAADHRQAAEVFTETMLEGALQDLGGRMPECYDRLLVRGLSDPGASYPKVLGESDFSIQVFEFQQLECWEPTSIALEF